MNLRALRAELERLRALVKADAPSIGPKSQTLAWGNQVLPLLKFEPAYYAMFNEAFQTFHANLTSPTVISLWHVMISQLDRAIADLTYRDAGLIADVEPVKLTGGRYVAQSRIDDLAGLSAPRFDVTKLLELLRELTDCQERRCYFAIAALVRTILNHVPPIFGYKTFAEVTANYGGGKSFKDSMVRLEESARSIADQHLHAMIRARESTPTLTQVDFSNELDVLLAEIVRTLKS
jgi:hypothetical protein